MQSSPSGGATPRHFSLNKKVDMVAVALQYDGWIVIYERGLVSGKVGNQVSAAGGMGRGEVFGLCVRFGMRDRVVGGVVGSDFEIG